MKKDLRFCIVLILATGVSLYAQNAYLEAIEVSQSADDGYRAVISEIGKSTAPILEIPQTVNVVTSQQLKDRRPESLIEALHNVSGISYANSVGGIFDATLKRGFGGNRDGSIMRNGVAAGVIHNFNATAQSIEVLKGPASVLYGIQDPGGVINIVTKKPLYEFANEIYASIGNRHSWKYGFDATGPIRDSGFAYRFIFEQNAKDYWREYGEYKNFTIAPSISYRSDEYRIDVAYTHSKYTDPVDRGMYLLTTDKKLLSVDKKRRLDEKFNEINGKVDTFDIGFEKNFGENWLLKGRYALSRSMYEYGQMRVMNINLKTGNATRRNEFYYDFEHRTHAGSLNLNGIFKTGLLNHNILFGIDVQENLRRRPKNARQTGAINNINIYSPVYGRIGTPTAFLSNSNQYEKTNTIGFYAQDNINLTDELIFVARLRYEYFDQLGGKGEPFKATTNQHNGKLLYNAGILYLLVPEWSVYTNYSQSFRPQSSIAAEVSSSLKPEQGDSIEFGTKFQNDNITATAAIFNINKKNVGYTTLIAGINTMLVSGKQRSRGFEFDISGHIAGGLSAGGSYTYTKTKELKNDDEPWRIGKAFEATPKHQASLFGNYDFGVHGIKGLRVGGGARYFGSWNTYDVKTGETYKLPHGITYDAFLAM